MPYIHKARAQVDKKKSENAVLMKYFETKEASQVQYYCKQPLYFDSAFNFAQMPKVQL